jgi:hypothetical protein
MESELDLNHNPIRGLFFAIPIAIFLWSIIYVVVKSFC